MVGFGWIAEEAVDGRAELLLESAREATSFNGRRILLLPQLGGLFSACAKEEHGRSGGRRRHSMLLLMLSTAGGGVRRCGRIVLGASVDHLAQRGAHFGRVHILGPRLRLTRKALGQQVRLVVGRQRGQVQLRIVQSTN